MKKNRIYLSVIIPCYNEAENLKRGVLEEVWQYLERQDYPWEVIISDDGSSDNSLELISAFAKNHSGFCFLKNKHGGKPWAVWKGIEAAKGEIIAFADMDQSTPIKELGKILPYFAQDYEIVIGSRGLKRTGFSILRRLGSVIFRVLRGIFLLAKIDDTQCGFKAFKGEVAKKIFPRLQFFQEINRAVKGWRVSAFDVELLFIAQKWGYKIKEVVVDWKDRDIAKGKQRKFVKESKEMAKEILRVRINDLKGKYER